MEMVESVPEIGDWARATRASAQKNSWRVREDRSCDVRLTICTEIGQYLPEGE